MHTQTSAMSVINHGVYTFVHTYMRMSVCMGVHTYVHRLYNQRPVIYSSLFGTSCRLRRGTNKWRMEALLESCNHPTAHSSQSCAVLPHLAHC